MAQTVSELWKTLWNMSNTQKEYAFEINGVWYGSDHEVNHDVDSAIFEDFGIGNAYIASITLGLYADDVPEGAEIRRYIRLVNGNQSSEWLPKGVFYARERKPDDGYWTVSAMDAMRKADVVWEPDQSLEFPMPMDAAVAEFARIMGVELDERNEISSEYTIGYPANNMTIRNELETIAAAHGENFIMSEVGKLRMLPLISAPKETSHLVNERGAAILIGGVAILVGDATVSNVGQSESEKYFVGSDLVEFSDNGKYKPVSRVTLAVDDINVITAGDDTGMELYAFCPHATQEMVDALLEKLRGYTYQAFEAEEANLNPSAELGDGVTVGGVYGVISKLRDDGSGYVGISAPGKAELEDGYPTEGPMTQMINRQLAGVRSSITKTAEQIRLEVIGEIFDENGNPISVASAITQTAQKITSEITKEYKLYTDGRLGDLGKDEAGNQHTVSSKIAQTAESISLEVSKIIGDLGEYSTVSSAITQTASSIKTTVTEEYKKYTNGKIGDLGEDESGEAYTVASKIEQTAKDITLEVTGYFDTDEHDRPVSVSSSIKAALGSIELSVVSENGTSTFAITSNGVEIDSQEIKLTVDAVNISGNVELGGLLSVYTDEDRDSVGGYLGYDDGFASSSGIGIRAYKSGSGPQMVCTDEAARISYTAYAGGNVAYQTGVICGQQTLTLDAWQLIQIRLGSDLTATYDIDSTGIYSISGLETLGTSYYPWADVYAGETSMLDLLDRVKKIEEALAAS